MRRMEEDKDFFKKIIEKRIPAKGSMIYTIAPQAGQGTMHSFQVMQGVEVIYNDIKLHKPVYRSLNIDAECIEITYCLKGQVEILFANQKYAYMMDGDISLFGYKSKVLSCDFSQKPCVSVTIMLYLPEIIQSLNSTLGTNEFQSESFLKNVFASKTCIISHANQSLEHIFKELFVLPDEYKNHLMKIKVIELLLYLMSHADYKDNDNDIIYFSKNSVDKIKEARQIILNNIDKHITVKRISEIVGMNSTDLEKGFKSIYGTTIFAYGKIFKMKKAKYLLSNENMSILEIALACGYKNGGKFAKAFKETFELSPLQYRKSLK